MVIKAEAHDGCLPQPDSIVVAPELLIGRKRRSNKERHIASVCSACTDGLHLQLLSEKQQWSERHVRTNWVHFAQAVLQ